MPEEREKIAFVCQRYGLEVNGGSELICRQLAEKMLALYDVEVYTTCADDSFTWKNVYPEGTGLINGVTVRRYFVEKERDMEKFNQFSEKVLLPVGTQRSDEVEEKWIDKQGPVCPALIEELKRAHKNYKAIIFVCYIYYTTVMGLQLGLDNAYLLPTLHDEPPVYLRCYDRVFASAKGFMWNTITERTFAYKRFPQIRNTLDVVAGVGVDVPEGELPALPEELAGVSYLVYAGRIDLSKNCGEMIEYFMRYKRRHPGKLKLVLMGKTNMELPDHPDIVYLGFVSDRLKFSVMREAKALVLFSRFESLSIVVLESMIMGRPVLVNGECEVLKQHCINSNAGLYFTDFPGFEMTLSYLLTHPNEYEVMRDNAIAYVEKNYQWDVIIKKIDDLISQRNLPDKMLCKDTKPTAEREEAKTDIAKILQELETEAKAISTCEIPHLKQLLGTKIRIIEPELPQNIEEGAQSMMLTGEIEYLRGHVEVRAYRHIYSCRRVVGPLIVFVKRVIRKLTKFYIEPITFDQTDVNTHMLYAIELMQDKLREQEEKIREQEQDIVLLKQLLRVK